MYKVKHQPTMVPEDDGKVATHGLRDDEQVVELLDEYYVQKEYAHVHEIPPMVSMFPVLAVGNRRVIQLGDLPATPDYYGCQYAEFRARINLRLQNSGCSHGWWQNNGLLNGGSEEPQMRNQMRNAILKDLSRTTLWRMHAREIRQGMVLYVIVMLCQLLSPVFLAWLLENLVYNSARAIDQKKKHGVISDGITMSMTLPPGRLPTTFEQYVDLTEDKSDILLIHNSPWIYVIYLTLLQIIIVIFTMRSEVLLTRIGLSVRSILSIVVYEISILNLTTEAVSAKDLNILAQDAQRFIEFTAFVARFVTAPIAIVLGIAYIWHLIGPSVLAGIGLFIIVMPITKKFGNNMQKLSFEKMTAADDRVNYINQVISSMRVVKSNSWEIPCLKQVIQRRNAELKALLKFALLKGVVGPIAITIPTLASVLTFLAYMMSKTGNELTAAKVFPVVAMFAVIRGPFVTLPIGLNLLVQVNASFVRLDSLIGRPKIRQGIGVNDVTFACISSGAPSVSNSGANATSDSNIDFEQVLEHNVGSSSSSLSEATLARIQKDEENFRTRAKMYSFARKTTGFVSECFDLFTEGLIGGILAIIGDFLRSFIGAVGGTESAPANNFVHERNTGCYTQEFARYLFHLNQPLIQRKSRWSQIFRRLVDKGPKESAKLIRKPKGLVKVLIADAVYEYQKEMDDYYEPILGKGKAKAAKAGMIDSKKNGKDQNGKDTSSDPKQEGDTPATKDASATPATKEASAKVPPATKAASANNTRTKNAGSPGISSTASSPSKKRDKLGEKNFKLHCNNVEIKRGSLTCIVGPVGAGKTSFLHALLGEMKPVVHQAGVEGSHNAQEVGSSLKDSDPSHLGHLDGVEGVVHPDADPDFLENRVSPTNTSPKMRVSLTKLDSGDDDVRANQDRDGKIEQSNIEQSNTMDNETKMVTTAMKTLSDKSTKSRKQADTKKNESLIEKSNLSVGFCGQSAFILNASVRENILFGHPYEESWYNDVLRICCLTEDMEQLVDRDMTEVGEKGVTLSGGQKTRISLARGLYCVPDVLLLDDVFSAWDVYVAEKIWGNLKLMKLGFPELTMILVTHNERFLIRNYVAPKNVSKKTSGVALLALQSSAEGVVLTAEERAEIDKVNNNIRRSSSTSITSVTSATSLTSSVALRMMNKNVEGMLGKYLAGGRSSLETTMMRRASNASSVSSLTKSLMDRNIETPWNNNTRSFMDSSSLGSSSPTGRRHSTDSFLGEQMAEALIDKYVRLLEKKLMRDIDNGRIDLQGNIHIDKELEHRLDEQGLGIYEGYHNCEGAHKTPIDFRLGKQSLSFRLASDKEHSDDSSEEDYSCTREAGPPSGPPSSAVLRKTGDYYLDLNTELQYQKSRTPIDASPNGNYGGFNNHNVNLSLETIRERNSECSYVSAFASYASVLNLDPCGSGLDSMILANDIDHNLCDHVGLKELREGKHSMQNHREAPESPTVSKERKLSLYSINTKKRLRVSSSRSFEPTSSRMAVDMPNGNGIYNGSDPSLETNRLILESSPNAQGTASPLLIPDNVSDRMQSKRNEISGLDNQSDTSWGDARNGSGEDDSSKSSNDGSTDKDDTSSDANEDDDVNEADFDARQDPENKSTNRDMRQESGNKLRTPRSGNKYITPTTIDYLVDQVLIINDGVVKQVPNGLHAPIKYLRTQMCKKTMKNLKKEIEKEEREKGERAGKEKCIAGGAMNDSATNGNAMNDNATKCDSPTDAIGNGDSATNCDSTIDGTNRNTTKSPLETTTRDFKLKTVPSTSAGNFKLKALSSTKLVEDETKETGSVAWRIWGLYLMSGCRSEGLMILFIFSFFIAEGGYCAVDLWLAQWSQDTFKEDKSFYLSIYCLIAIVYMMLQLGRSLAMAIFGYKSGALLHDHLLHSTLFTEYNFFEKTPSGRIMARFSKDVNDVDMVLPDRLQFLLMCGLRVLSIQVIIVFSAPYFLFFFVFILALYSMVTMYYRETSRELQRLEAITRAPVYGKFIELVNGLVTIRAFKREKIFTRRYLFLLEENFITFQSQRVMENWLTCGLMFLGSLVIFGSCVSVLLLYENKVDEGREFNVGMAGLALSVSFNVIINMNAAAKSFAQVEAQMNAVERVDQYSNLKQEDEPEFPGYRVRGHTNIPGKPVKIKYYRNGPELIEYPEQTAADDGIFPENSISFQSCTLVYRPGLPPAVKDFSVFIPAGESIGICGRTGSGKSSLFAVLLRLVNNKALTNGRILIGKVDITTIKIGDVRKYITVIPQDPVLFSGTLRSNVDVFGTCSDEAVLEALEKAQLGFDVAELTDKVPEKSDTDKVPIKSGTDTGVIPDSKNKTVSLTDVKLNMMPDSVSKLETVSNVTPGATAYLNSPVTTNGENWSAGERQLICFARAIVKIIDCKKKNEKREKNDGVNAKSVDTANGVGANGVDTNFVHTYSTPGILLLDEATSVIDRSTDEKIQKTLRQVFKSQTRLIIAHRLETILDSDKILVMSDGNLAEFDMPSRLLANERSLFRKLKDGLKK